MNATKRTVQSLFRMTGYRVSRMTVADSFAATRSDAAEVQPFLGEIIPAVAGNATTNRFPTPSFVRAYFTPQRIAMSRLLLDACDSLGVKFDNRHILDVGCHAGYLLRCIMKRYENVEVHGCDILDDKINMARLACPQADLFISQISALPKNRKYGVVFLNEVLEHVVDPENVVRHLLEVKSSDGELVLTVPDGREDCLPAYHFNEEFGSYGGHINFWSPESWHLFLSKSAPGHEITTMKLAYGSLLAVLRKGDEERSPGDRIHGRVRSLSRP